MEKSSPLPEKLQQRLRALGHQLELSRSAIGDANIAARVGKDAYAVADAREGGLALAAGPPKAKDQKKKE
jgi:gamma-glutamyltranspeptidase